MWAELLSLIQFKILAQPSCIICLLLDGIFAAIFFWLIAITNAFDFAAEKKSSKKKVAETSAAELPKDESSETAAESNLNSDSGRTSKHPEL